MKKKIVMMAIMCFLLCGCTNIKNLNYDQIINTFDGKKSHINVYRTGYKYSLPRTMQVQSFKLFNEVLTSNKATFYLYVDAVSYYNKTNNELKNDTNSNYFKTFSYNDKQGCIRINKKENNKYLIEIIYNYAKIEVMVEEDDINESMLYAIEILKNISYNDSVIANLLGSDVLTYKEEDYNIFNTTSSDSNYLDYDSEYKWTDETEIYDSDLIN